MRLNEITDRAGARKASRRLGRGIGSGRGKTAGRGHKGQKARAGVALKGFEGGQMPIHRRVPKRGFKNPTRKRLVAVNLERLQQAVDAGRLDPAQAVTEKTLCDSGVVTKARDGVRLLAKGDLKAKLSVEVHGASKAAIAAITAAGGKITVTAPPRVKADKSAKKAKKAKGDKKAKAGAKAGQSQGAAGSEGAAGVQDAADAGGPDDA